MLGLDPVAQLGEAFTHDSAEDAEPGLGEDQSFGVPLDQAIRHGIVDGGFIEGDVGVVAGCG